MFFTHHACGTPLDSYYLQPNESTHYNTQPCKSNEYNRILIIQININIRNSNNQISQVIRITLFSNEKR